MTLGYGGAMVFRRCFLRGHLKRPADDLSFNLSHIRGASTPYINTQIYSFLAMHYSFNFFNLYWHAIQWYCICMQEFLQLTSIFSIYKNHPFIPLLWSQGKLIHLIWVFRYHQQVNKLLIVAIYDQVLARSVYLIL